MSDREQIFEKAALHTLHGGIAKMTPKDRKRVEQAYLALRKVVKEHGDHGDLALAVYGLERSVNDPEMVLVK